MKHFVNSDLADGYNCQACGSAQPSKATIVLEDFKELPDGVLMFEDFHPLCGHHAEVLVPEGTPTISVG
jgi:hypothetical protein